jgi:AcrR family transcriptional regulator
MAEPSLVATHPDVEPLLAAPAGAQRARLLEGMTQAVADKGYVAATVTDAVRAARVSRGTFYALFDSKEACFLEAYRHGIDVLVEAIERAVAAEPGDWVAKLRAALRAYLVTLADEPRFARTHLLEIHAAGARAQAERDATLRRFADRYRASFEAGLKDRPDLAMPSDDALFVLAAGVDQLVCARVREGALDQLPTLEETLAACAIGVFLGTTTNNEERS